jgi:zona occludens toxin (predicted ATPase)
MKLQTTLIIVNKETSEGFPYSAMSDIADDFKDLGKSLSWLQKEDFPIILEKYVIWKKPLRKTKYVRTNHKRMNSRD